MTWWMWALGAWAYLVGFVGVFKRFDSRLIPDFFCVLGAVFNPIVIAAAGPYWAIEAIRKRRQTP